MDAVGLQSIPLFAGLSRKERRMVAQGADQIEVEAGRALVREGEFAYEFFAIDRGTAEVRRGEQLLAELGPGDFFGEMGLIGDARRSASVIAITDLSVVVMTGSAFRQIDRELPDVSREIRKAIEERARNLMPVE